VADLTFNKAHFPNETLAAWAERYFKAAAGSHRLYRSPDAGFIYIDPIRGPRRLLTVDDFFGVAYAVVEVFETRARRDGHEEFTVSAALTPTEVRQLFESPQAGFLPSIETLLTEPVVIPQADGSYRATTPGYDPEALTYYWTGAGSPITPLPEVRRLLECFSGVPFERPEYKHNLFAWLLGAVCFDPALDSPLLVCTGNQQGVGKSSCVQAAGHVLAGRIPSPLNFRGGEFWKDVSAHFIENERFMFLDNIVSHRAAGFDNPHLSTLLTQGRSKRIRILGHSRLASANGLLFAASLNDAKLSSDLADRSLLVKLYRDVNQPMVPYCRDYAQRHRAEIYGELLGLALRKPQPLTLAPNSTFRFRRWFDFVAARITQTFGPLALQESADLDDLSQELFAYGFDNVNTEFDADTLIRAVQSNPDRYPSFAARLSNISSDRARKISIARILKARAFKFFAPVPGQPSTLRLIDLENGDTHHAATFVFREATE